MKTVSLIKAQGMIFVAELMITNSEVERLNVFF